MIAATRSALSTGFGLTGQPQRLWNVFVTFAPTGSAAHRPAPAPKPRRVADLLEGLLTDGEALAQPNLAHAAARAFTAGDGFLPGQIIDRSI